MKTKTEPKVEQSIKVTLEGKTVEMSRADALTLFNALKKELNLPEPPEKIVYRDSGMKPYYSQPSIPNPVPPEFDRNKFYCGTPQHLLRGNDCVAIASSSL